MIDDLMKGKKITPNEFKIYSLYTSPLGHECLQQMMEEVFMEEPIGTEFSGEGFAFYSGRQSIIRGIKATIHKVQSIIKEENYVGTETQ
jgi:hypothetical protein